MRVNVYVDGFNLYNGLLRESDYRWLNPVELFDRIFVDYEVNLVRFFTAVLKGKASPGDPGIVARQMVYLRALATIERLQTHLGRFEVRASRYRRRFREPSESEMVDVWRPEEKGSDVNLATYLVRDAFLDTADVYVIVSNDSDLETPIRLVATELGKRVFLVFPHGRESRDLMECGHERVVWISTGRLAESLLPNPVMAETVPLFRPAEWLPNPDRRIARQMK
ncbi:NYN domain-containing protein [Frondihabitans australicus]|uniref:NYN domain-containing protein n=2 Tax=Frondihabitans australicus TaxID=386892 RepID=A0A495IK47_9MICO|nr:NYN domain-containing protein [Frondihabitans australicus]